MVSEPTVLQISSIRRDGGTQPRDHISMEIAKDYSEAILDGAAMPPVTVFYDGSNYWLADGFHRVEAHLILAGAELIKPEIAADVHQGTQRDAVLFSVGANASHGYRRSNMDKRRAVLVLLNDPEWRDWSDRAIARRCNVGRDLVATLRPPVTVGSDSDEVRTFIDRNGKPSHMKVAAIGKKKPDLPVIAGKQAERKPNPEVAGMQDTVGVGMASAITGLSPRHVKELAREGKIEGAEKDGGQWLMPTAAVAALVEESRQPEVRPQIEDEPEPEPEPFVYDHAKGALLLAFSDTVERIAAWPSVDEVLAAWASDIGAAPRDEAIAEAGSWMADFAARWPLIAAERSARINALIRGN